MSKERLKQVVYELPGPSRKAQQFFAALAQLLEEVEGSTLGGGQVVIKQPGLLPETIFRIVNRSYPAVHFDVNQPLRLRPGNLVLSSAAADYPTVEERDEPPHEEGGYVQLPAGSEDFTALLPMGAVYERLRGHVLHVDHTGINLPTKLINGDEWKSLITTLAGVSTMYRYPTGEDWPFIIPSTADEFAADIVEAQPVRQPKFELVYDSTLGNPLIQIDLETDLARDEIEALFPAPYGVGLPGLDQYFRSVYVYHPWPGLSLRIDIGYGCDAPVDIAGWLVHEGGRIGVDS
jgi:hypothetical protein